MRIDPKATDAWYWRGRRKQNLGDAASGNADIAHARTLDPSVGK